MTLSTLEERVYTGQNVSWPQRLHAGSAREFVRGRLRVPHKALMHVPRKLLPAEALPGGLRKQPLQERSKIAIGRVLDAAAELVLEHGPEVFSVSPGLLYERSGISRGSFYAFFDSPQRVLDELALERMQCSQVEFENMFAGLSRNTWTEIVDGLIEQYSKSFRNPLIRRLWVDQHHTSNIRSLERLWGERLAENLLDEFSYHAPKFRRLTVTQCRVVVEILERLTQNAFREHSDGDPVIITEIRTVLIGYLSSFE